MRRKFEVPGDPVGYVATTSRGKWSAQYQRFAEYAKRVRFYARASGISTPLLATKGHPLTIRTISYFANGRHPDPGNVQKGVVDALFYDEKKADLAKLYRKMGKKMRTTGKGNDKYTGGSFPPPLYDSEHPRVVVIIKDYQPKKRKKNGQEEEKRPPKKRPKRARASSRTKASQAGAIRSEESE